MDNLIPAFSVGKVKASSRVSGISGQNDFQKYLLKAGYANLSLEEFRNVMLLDGSLASATVIETDDHILIKFESNEESDNRAVVPVPPLEKSAPVDSLASAIYLLGKVVSGVVNWIIGG